MHVKGLLFRPTARPVGFRPHPVFRPLHRQHLYRLAAWGLSSFPPHLSGRPSTYQSDPYFCFSSDHQLLNPVESHHLARKVTTHLAQFLSLR